MDKRGWRLPKWLLNWMASLLPSQTSSGSGSVQIGQVNGDVNNVTNHIQAPPVHVTQVFYSTQVQTQQAAANGTATLEQRELLTLIRRMPNNGESVFRFMQREFNTRMVIDLRPSELRRVQSYVASINKAINKRVANGPSEGTTCRESA